MSEGNVVSGEGPVRASRMRERLGRVRPWVTTMADRHHSVGVLVAVFRLDVQIGGTLLAGALAFRLFVWLLPCCLLMAAALGFTASDGHAVDQLAEDNGLSPVTASALGQIAGQAEHGRYLTGVLGLLLLFVAGMSLGRALDRVHLRIWRDTLDGRIMPTVNRAARYTAVLLLVVVDNITWPLLTAATGLSAALFMLPNLAIHVVLTIVLFTGDWPPRWRPHLPGAVLVALGAAGLHLVSVLYLPHKLARASQLYGTLGVAATMLIWLALIARLLVLGQVLNVALHDGRSLRLFVSQRRRDR